MCGIAGAWGVEDKDLVRRMCDRLEHRGPDGHGLWSGTGATLGHRRLAIVDVATGQQPMQDASGRLAIVYNGEIYNHQALRAELEQRGAVFRTHSDTEVILEAWKAWGPASLARLEGMYAFALVDTTRNEFVLARDPWGIKPLHVTEVGGVLLFASEAKAFAAHDGFRFRPDEDAFRQWAVFEYPLGTRTFFSGVRQVKPATCEVHHKGRNPEVIPTPLPETGAAQDPEAFARQLRQALAQSVQEQLMSEVPLGTVLSGGLDSSAVAALQRGHGTLRTFAIAESDEVEDLRVARRVAEHLGAEHHEATFTLEDVRRDLARHAYHNEASNYTEFFFLPLFANVRKHATVALCGQGSDELWGGYGRYKDPERLMRSRFARFHRARPRAPGLGDALHAAHASGEALARWDQEAQLANFQLRLVDRNSMASSVEVRVPFLSRTLTSLSYQAPWDWKVRDGVEKWVLRRALADAGLPDDVLHRPKVPAGRATAPTVMGRFEDEAKRLRPNWKDHALAPCFQDAAEALAYDVWHEVFVERQGSYAGVTLEDLA